MFCCLCEYDLTHPAQEGEAGLVYHPEYLKQGTLFVQDIQKKG